VIERVADDGILLAQKRLEHPAIGIEAGRVQDGVLRTVEGGQFVFQFLMDILRAADEAYTAHAEAVTVQRGMRCLEHLGVRGEPQVIVGAEVQHLPTVHGDLRVLLAGDDAFTLEETGLFDGLQFALQVGLETAVHGGS